MNIVDMILFNATHSPEKVALTGDQAVLSYGQLGHGILAAERKLASLGLERGCLAGVHIGHPIDHMVLTLALHHMGIGSAPVETLLNAKSDVPPLSLILTDRVLPPDVIRRFPSTILLFDPGWFKVETEVGAGHRTADPLGGTWIARAFVDAEDARGQVVALTAGEMAAQLQHFYIAALPRWDRLVTTFPVTSNPGFLLPMMALWLGRTACFATPDTARELVILHGHDYLVTSQRHAQAIVRLQEENYRSIHALRGAFVLGSGSGFDREFVMRAQSAISSNLTCGLVTPSNGLVAFAPAAQFKEGSATAGLLAPWAEAEADDNWGELRVRLKPAAGTTAKPWERAARSAQVRADGMLLTR